MLLLACGRYFQEPLYFFPARQRIQQMFRVGDPEMGLVATRPSSMAHVQQQDVVIHIRCCEGGGMCSFLFLPFRYYDEIISHIRNTTAPGENVTIWAVTKSTCAKGDKGIVPQLVVHATPTTLCVLLPRQ
mmetsp:Transcript_2349/g.6839  ORF Transcript_2349/g.6839 Transcript_2349/m.6839 type:complete len:130 (-) Transcript_2349:596-985(-)